MANNMINIEDFRKLTESEQFGKLLEAAEEAKKDDTPYVALVDDEINVLGNPNKTELKKHDYTVEFTIPNTEQNKSILKATDIPIEMESENYLLIKREFKGVYVAARRATDIVEAFTRVQTFINKVTIQSETGELEIAIRTEKEMLEIMSELNQDVEEALYRAVGTFFGLSSEETDQIVLSSAIFNTIMIAVNNPEVMNGSEVFFGSSRGK